MEKILVILGPTASGKTNLAFCLAKKFNGSLVSCDSVQVYKHLDVLSGKDIPAGSKFFNLTGTKFNFGYYLVNQVKIFLLDLVTPDYAFNVSDFLDAYDLAFEYIKSNKEHPILVGGAGFYIKALLNGAATLKIPQNKILRDRLEKESVEVLSELLRKEDYKRFAEMNESDVKNKRRLIRAIEVAEYKKSSKFKVQNSKLRRVENADILKIGLYANREELKKRIDKRVEGWLTKGAVIEVRKLFGSYSKLSNQVKSAIGYRQIFDYLAGKENFEDAIKKLKTGEYQYVKKQMTYLKKDKSIKWFDITDPSFMQKVEEQVSDWYNT